MEDPTALKKAQIEAILALLRSFGAKDAVIDNVDAALSEQIPLSLNIYWTIAFLVMVISLVQTYTPVAVLTNLIAITDSYLRVVLNSWPAVVFVLGIILLFKYKTSIAIFIEKRVTSIGLSGVSAATQTDARTHEEITNVQPTINKHGSDDIKRIQFFERLHGTIYGTQIKLLFKLNTVASGLNMTEAAQFYVEALGKNPELKNYTYPNYLNFLVSLDLVSLVGDFTQGVLQITPLGKDFLTYITTYGLSIEKPN